MPDLNDYDKNDEDKGGASLGYTPAQSEAVDQKGTSSGAPKWAQNSPAQEREFVPWSSFASANSEVSAREANMLSGRVQGDVSRAQDELTSAQQGFDSSFGKNYGQNGDHGAEQGGEMGSMVAQAKAPVADYVGPSTQGSTNAVAQQQQTPAVANLPKPIPQTVPGKGPGRKAKPPAGGSPAPPPGETPETSQTSSQQATPEAQAALQQSTGNPWAELAGDNASPAATQGTAPAQATPAANTAGNKPPPPPGYAPTPQSPAAPPPLSDADRQAALTQEAMGGGVGPHDLEGSAGQQAWAQLLGDTIRGEQEANALGSEKGVQALLQRDNPYADENSAFDAALLEGPGQRQFRDLSRQYGQGSMEDAVVKAEQASQDKWKQLQGDIDARKKREAAAKAAADQGQAAPQPEAQHPPEEAGTVTGDNGDKLNIHSVLFGDNQPDAWSVMHEAGISMSPADQLDITAAEASDTDIPLPTEAYVSAVAGPAAAQTKSSWPAAKVEMAFGRVASHWPSQGLQALLLAMKRDPAMLRTYLNMKNPGYMSKQMSKWLAAHGYQQRGDHDNIHETRGLGYGSTYADSQGRQHTTTDEQESARVIAYREGWGQSWDDQFNNGNDDPQRP